MQAHRLILRMVRIGTDFQDNKNRPHRANAPCDLRFFWSGGLDSNQRPLDPQPRRLAPGIDIYLRLYHSGIDKTVLAFLRVSGRFRMGTYQLCNLQTYSVGSIVSKSDPHSRQVHVMRMLLPSSPRCCHM